MLKPIEAAIGLRYTRAKRRNHFISFISAISILGIALGVAALITVISVMNGFEGELRNRILGMVSHATISGVGSGMSDWQLALDEAKKNKHVLGAAPYIEKVVLLQGDAVSGAMLRGVDPTLESSVSELSIRMIEGQFQQLVPGQFNVVLGQELAMILGVGVGDNINIIAPEVRMTPAGMIPQSRSFEVTGIFAAGMQEYDAGLAVIHLGDAAKLFRMGSSVSGVRLKLDDMFRAWDVAREVGDQLGGLYRVSDWSREHSNFFRAVKTEKIVMFVILCLIVAVAAFNLVSTLVMLVTDKQADIAILRTLGLTPRSVMAVFMVQGTIVGVVGILLGLLGGVLLTLNLHHVLHFFESMLGFELMPADIYYISDLPTQLLANDVIKIAVLSFIMCSLATIYPAWRAARVQPAEALRYE